MVGVARCAPTARDGPSARTRALVLRDNVFFGSRPPRAGFLAYSVSAPARISVIPPARDRHYTTLVHGLAGICRLSVARSDLMELWLACSAFSDLRIVSFIGALFEM